MSLLYIKYFIEKGDAASRVQYQEQEQHVYGQANRRKRREALGRGQNDCKVKENLFFQDNWTHFWETGKLGLLFRIQGYIFDKTGHKFWKPGHLLEFLIWITFSENWVSISGYRVTFSINQVTFSGNLVTY